MTADVIVLRRVRSLQWWYGTATVVVSFECGHDGLATEAELNGRGPWGWRYLPCGICEGRQ